MFFNPSSILEKDRLRKSLPSEKSLDLVHTDVVALNGGLGGTEAQTNLLIPPPNLASLLALGLGLRVQEDVRLLLESALRLDGQLGRHGCGLSTWGEGRRSRDGMGLKSRWGKDSMCVVDCADTSPIWG